MNTDRAEEIALAALAWLAADAELCGVFLGASGATAEDLRLQASDPAFLGAVLDFVLMDDAWVTRFCDDTQMAYEAPMQARAALPGGEQVHWT